MPAVGVHFNGSVNLPDAETVMREISSRIPAGVRRMTEGETGDRGQWVQFQRQKFAAMPEFEEAPVPETGSDYERIPVLQLVAGVAPDAVRWPDIGYAAAYTDSFETFRRLQDEGIVASDARLQLQFPTPIAALSMVTPDDAQRLAPHYAAALFADLQQALNLLPHDRIAVQWDVAVEIGLLSGGFHVEPPFEAVIAGLVACLDQIPDDVPAGVHLCYGDYQHAHFVEPESLALQVRVLNALTESARRPPAFAAFTVPQGRRDAGYFEPLRDLRASPATELAFALVPYHPDDQAPGTTAEQATLIDTFLGEASAGARDWSVCTECGMGRVEQEDVPRLLDLHREIVAGHLR